MRSSPTAWGSGTLSRISIENLDNQARDVRETRAAAFTAAEAPAVEAAARARSTAATPTEAPALGVVAVVAGDGLAAIFREFGVAAVVHGGQTTNPSTGELLEAIRGVAAREVIVLPNNPNVVLAARQVAGMADRPVVVVPTRNAAEGFAALLALDPNLDADGQRRPDDRGRARDPDRRRHRGGPRRDDRRPQGQARPDHRPGPGRRAHRRRAATATRRSSPRSRR